MLYFAYGSNMNHEQMKERCPYAQFLERAYLEDFKFVYDGYSKSRSCAVANVVQLSGNRVWGGLFEINKDNLATLDCYEGYPKSYSRDELEIRDDEGRSYKAIVYFRTGEKPGEPSEDYRETIIQGAGDCNLPAEYMQSL